MDDHIKFLLEYCSKYPELYNKVSTKLWVQFGIQRAELSLLCTFIANEMLKDEVKNGIKRQNKKIS